MGLKIHTHQNFNPPTESGVGAVSFYPQLPTRNQQPANVRLNEYQPVKKSRTSQATANTSMPVLINKPTLSIPLNNELCLQFQRGHCIYGNTCHFAHVIGDTQKLLPRRQELLAKKSNAVRNWNEDQKIISAMNLCRWFCGGEECPYGERCNFLHEDPARFRKSFATRMRSTGPGVSSRNGCDQVEFKTFMRLSLIANSSQKPIFWKTRLCNNWGTTGYCPYGVNCHFAHGNAELQKFGSQKEMESGNFSSSNMPPAAAGLTSLCRAGNGTTSEQPIQCKECLFKRKAFEKMRGIYADWIDDIHPVHGLMGKVESCI
ncbi:hypothetical protein NMG60_11004927 [Bertholletia excelsa]